MKSLASWRMDGNASRSAMPSQSLLRAKVNCCLSMEDPPLGTAGTNFASLLSGTMRDAAVLTSDATEAPQDMAGKRAPSLGRGLLNMGLRNWLSRLLLKLAGVALGPNGNGRTRVDSGSRSDDGNKATQTANEFRKLAFDAACKWFRGLRA